MSLGFLSPLVEAEKSGEEDKVRQGVQSGEGCEEFKGWSEKGDGEEDVGRRVDLLGLVLGLGLGHSETHEDKDDLNLALSLLWTFMCPPNAWADLNSLLQKLQA